ncbi:MAG: ATP-binding protein [Candidatus Magnetomorum sp.]|nr:ATP-binding protein [Candidatus Magnetomorum sp.]
MILEQLKQKIKLRSFWEAGTEKFLLPPKNLTRSSYLSKLSQLQDINVVTSIMGQRRCGKSVIGRQYIKMLWDEGIPKKNILYINFFLKPIADIKAEKNFIAIVEWWIENHVDKEHPCMLFLDEVQELENWDENVASIFEDPSIPCRLMITGSNSKMLTEDLSAKLGGRYTTLQVFPFSFAEFCRFNHISHDMIHLEKYLREGGMPEVLKINDEEQRLQLISDIMNSTVKNDIILRYNPSNPGLLFALIEFCRTSFAQELSIKSISNIILKDMKMQRKQFENRQSTSSLVKTYIDYMKDVYFVYSPETYSYRSKDILKRSVDKIYLSDLCFANYKTQTQKGRLLENMIYIELLRHNYKVQRFLGYRNKNLEIDFYIEKNNQSALVQVCWQLGDINENKMLWDREFGNLYYTNLNIPKIVVSLDEKIDSPYKDVEHLNIMHFLSVFQK